MTFRDFFVSLRRHPMVALVMIALTGLLAFRTVNADPSYEARAVLTFLSPVPAPRNTFADFPPFLVLMADVSARTMDTPDGRRAVREAGGSAGFKVVLANRGSQEVPIHDQPYLSVLVTSGASAEAKRTLGAVLTVLRRELLDRQLRSGADRRSLVTWRVTESTREPVPHTGKPTRRLAAILAAGAIGTVYAALLAERYAPRRRRRTGPGTAAGAGAGAVTG